MTNNINIGWIEELCIISELNQLYVLSMSYIMNGINININLNFSMYDKLDFHIEEDFDTSTHLIDGYYLNNKYIIPEFLNDLNSYLTLTYHGKLFEDFKSYYNITDINTITTMLRDFYFPDNKNKNITNQIIRNFSIIINQIKNRYNIYKFQQKNIII